MANTKSAVQEASVVEISNKPIDFQDRIELLENAWRMLPAMEMYHCGKCGNYYSTDGDPHKC